MYLTFLAIISLFVWLLLIAFCVFVAILHPDPKKNTRARKVLRMLLRSISTRQ